MDRKLGIYVVWDSGREEDQVEYVDLGPLGADCSVS